MAALTHRQRDRSRLWRNASIAGFTVWLCLAAALHLSAQAPSEYQVKAAYLFGFGRFIEWPASSETANSPDFVICVLGDDPFGRFLDDAAAGGGVGGKPVRLARLPPGANTSACHVLYVSASEETRMASVLAALRARPVLTVSDIPNFAQRGGMIGFTLDRNRVRFVANLEASQRAGLTLNSELLRVAAAVVRDRARE